MSQLSAIRASGLAAEKAELLDALERARGNVAHVARILGRLRCQRIMDCGECDHSCWGDVSRASVYRMMAKHGVAR